MYISKVYLTDNFVPDYVTDQFRRRVAGYEVILSEWEDYKEAERLADEKIADYIKRNTVDNTMSGTQVRTIEPLLAGSEAIESDIKSCKELKVLESYRLIVKNNPELQEAYDNKLKELQ